jgi:RNA-directed DNA polymerase
MKHLHLLAKLDPGKRFNRLWENLIQAKWLAQAWEEIRRNRGSQTPGIDRRTALDVHMKLIFELADELKRGDYRPKPVRRVYIQKANGKQRPLEIAAIKGSNRTAGLKNAVRADL